MSDDAITIEEGKPPSLGFESIGPFSVWKITVDSYRVPGLTGRVDEETGMLHLCLDERWGIEVPRQYGTQVCWLIANALAIGAGYSCFGEHSLMGDPNKFKCRVTEIATVPEIEMPEITDTAS
jgi:hypothetical protein